jgi:broad specificity phosphatase PhoE/ribonuclease HI
MARKLIVEADGASRGNPGPASYGALVVDDASGEVLAELAEPIGIETNNVAEYRGLIAGLRAAAAIDPDAEVEVRMDSKLAVQQMSGEWQIRHPAIRPLAATARAAFPAPERVTYTWVPRELNKRADALGNLALDDPEEAAARTALAAVVMAAGPAAGASGSTAARDPQGALSSVPAESTTSGPAKPSAASESTSATAGPSAGWAPADLGPPTTLILLRHGATPLTAEKRFSGAGDPELAASGRAQAAAAARLLAQRGGIDVILSSPSLRTRQTAQAVADALGLAVVIEEDFRETDFGLWDGYSFAEVRERWPAELSAWLASTAVAPPGGESFDVVAKRVHAAAERTVARYPRRNVLVVSHVTPIKTLVREAVGAPPEALFSMELSAAALSAVTYYGDGRSSLRLFNETSHLSP